MDDDSNKETDQESITKTKTGDWLLGEKTNCTIIIDLMYRNALLDGKGNDMVTK